MVMKAENIVSNLHKSLKSKTLMLLEIKIKPLDISLPSFTSF